MQNYSFLLKGERKLGRKELSEEKGFALVLGMLLLLVATLIGISALNTSTFDVLISGNERASVQAFYIAEAGINEFIGRFRAGATNEILDNDPSNPDWKVLLARYPGKGATKIGYLSGILNSYSSLQSQLDFGVEIKHKIDAANQVVRYGGVPIYIIKSYGFTEDGGNKVLEVELKKSSDYDPPAALYSKMTVHIDGSSTYINGNDGCGPTHHKPGVITPTDTIPSITESGNPSINGSPPTVTLASHPPPTTLQIKEMLDYVKGHADFRYQYSGDQTLTGYSNVWGSPTNNDTGVPITYTGPMNIIYFNMNGDKTLTLAGGSRGAGLLLIEGNLEINGEFTWYGVILVTGTVRYTGGGEKNITGGILSGGNIKIEGDLGGNSGTLYCSGVSKRIKDIIPSSIITRWREVF